MFKKIFVGVISAGFLIASMPSEAAFGHSSSSSRSSSTRSYSAPTHSYSSPSVSSSSRNSSISQGRSLGSTDSSVTQSVRNGSYKQTAPSNNSTVAGSRPYTSPSYGSGSNYNSNYGGGSYYNHGGGYSNYGGGHSTGALIAAAGAGALAGYLLHRDSSGNVYYTNPGNPGVAYNGSGQALSSVPQGDYQVQGTVASVSSGHPFIWFLIAIILILAIVALIIGIARRR